jgi:hypothetical protein
MNILFYFCYAWVLIKSRSSKLLSFIIELLENFSSISKTRFRFNYFLQELSYEPTLMFAFSFKIAWILSWDYFITQPGSHYQYQQLCQRFLARKTQLLPQAVQDWLSRNP